MRAARRTSGGSRSRDARKNALKLDWASYQPPKPCFLGTRVFEDYSVAELIDYIDWSPFFSTWELTGKFPAILDDEKFGEAARALYEDARAMLDKIVEENWFRAAAIVGFWPANSDGDDILRRGATASTCCTRLRQQLARREGRANVALADFVAPKDSGRQDYIGAFVVTAGIGEDVIADRFKHANDDYSSIMVKALADRLAEAFAERMHQRVRKEFWGYAADETLASRELIEEKYRGIRPAPGYPAQPDHTEKATLFGLIDGERIGVKLTESFAMWPGASVSGLYFSHPEAHYFGVGKIERDQVEDYAARKGWSVAGSRALARADPQLRSARAGARGGGVICSYVRDLVRKRLHPHQCGRLSGSARRAIGPLRRGRDRAVDMRADRVVAHRIAPVDQVLLILLLHARKAGRERRERLGQRRRAGQSARCRRIVVRVRGDAPVGTLARDRGRLRDRPRIDVPGFSIRHGADSARSGRACAARAPDCPRTSARGRPAAARSRKAAAAS